MSPSTTEPVTAPAEAARSALRRFLLPDWQQRKRMFRQDAWLVVAGSYGLLLAAYLWPQDFRSHSQLYNLACYGLFMVRTFLWHMGLVILLIGLLAAWRRTWWLAAATAPLLVATLAPEAWDFLPKSPQQPIGAPITVMSINLLYNNYETSPIIEEIRAADPDILLLQEYAPAWHQAILNAIGSRYPYIRHVLRDDPFGAAIYSRIPFVGDVETGLLLGNIHTPQIRAVVRIANQDVALYNIHLQPPYGLLRTMIGRQQLADLQDMLAGEKLPVILSGDFNFTDRSPNADLLHGIGLVAAHSLAGWGRGSTWPVNDFLRYVPGLRLDHIYLSRRLTCSESRTGIGTGSDHRPIVARVGLSDGLSSQR